MDENTKVHTEVTCSNAGIKWFGDDGSAALVWAVFNKNHPEVKPHWDAYIAAVGEAEENSELSDDDLEYHEFNLISALTGWPPSSYNGPGMPFRNAPSLRSRGTRIMVCQRVGRDI